MLLWQMFPDYDLQWTDQVPIKGKTYHLDLVAKSELLEVVFRFHHFPVMDQYFMMALGDWTTTRKQEAPDFIFLGNIHFFFPDFASSQGTCINQYIAGVTAWYAFNNVGVSEF